MAAASEPADREELKNSPFSKGEWPVAFDIDVGYDRLRELLQSGEDEGFMSLTAAPRCAKGEGGAWNTSDVTQKKFRY